MLKFVEVFIAYGHEAVKATHPTTLEVTKERNLTSKGDCIVAVGASKSTTDLSENFKILARKPSTKITLKIRVGELVEVVEGFGNPNLTLNHPTDIVVRKSTYTCPRTVMVKANKAAINLHRQLISKLKNPNTLAIITLTAENSGL
ncbi:MAG: DUF371 domain-containing protein [Candidatus Bathyarchaeota archaeon]|nr:DUF371 domain-containing protein [Candidatus Bathyarchaeota archaeon]